MEHSLPGDSRARADSLQLARRGGAMKSQVELRPPAWRKLTVHVGDSPPIDCPDDRDLPNHVGYGLIDDDAILHVVPDRVELDLDRVCISGACQGGYLLL